MMIDRPAPIATLLPYESHATASNPALISSSHRSRYHKAIDNRKHPIRGLWTRNRTFLARLKVEKLDGQNKLKRVELTATTAAEAVEEMKVLHVERRENRLRQHGQPENSPPGNAEMEIRLTSLSELISLDASALHPDLSIMWNTSIFHRMAILIPLGAGQNSFSTIVHSVIIVRPKAPPPPLCRRIP